MKYFPFKTKGIRIRSANYTDIDAMVELLKTLFSVEEDFQFDEELQRKGLSIMLKAPNESRCLLVAESESKVIGMCSAQTLVSTAEGGIVAIVEDLVVKENWRGKGIGRLLIKAIEKWGTKHVLRFQLLCDRENERAIRFYQKNGWKLTQLICLRNQHRTNSKQPIILPGGQFCP